MGSDARDMAADYSLDDLAAFREYDDALALGDDGLPPPPPKPEGRACGNCGGRDVVYSTAGSGHSGAAVCPDCGAVLDHIVIFERMHGCVLSTRHSNYRRIHHAHERISQLLIQETPIPLADLVAICEGLLQRNVRTLNKASVRGVLRSLSMQRYIERWLQIVQRLADAAPPRPGPQLLIQVDSIFQELQAPFEAIKPKGRSNFPNYNYIFCRIFQHLGCSEFGCFFPLVKSKAKLEALNAMWFAMCDNLRWPKEPLQAVPEFAIAVDRAALEARLTSLRLAPEETAARKGGPTKTALREWNRYSSQERQRHRKQQARSSLAAPLAPPPAKRRRLPRPRA